MILRKPYALLIKNFKLIHLIMTILITYSIYRSNIILSFLNEWIASTQVVTNTDLTGKLFNITMFIVPFLVILFSVIIASLMYIKKKPIIFYLINIVVCVVLFIIYNIAFGVINTMETQLVDIRTARLIRDFLSIAFALQCLSVAITFIRATGFDIRKFNFVKDLEELEIEVEDNEEFEVDVVFDTEKMQRGFKRNLRYIRYIYVENKFLINIVTLLGISVICFVIYLNLSIYNKTYDEKVTFLSTDFTMTINNSYIVSKDYRGNTIKNGKSFVILEVKLRSNSIKGKKLEIARSELVIGNQKFYHTTKYNEKFTDLGKTYSNEIIGKNNYVYLLVYEIPNSLINKEATFTYIDRIDTIGNRMNPKYIRVKLNKQKLDVIKEVKEYWTKSEINFEGSIFKKTVLSINNYDISDKFKLDYNFCVTSSECYKSVEYVMPTISGNYNKTLLKLEGLLTLDENLTNGLTNNLHNFLASYGEIQYQINNETKTNKIPLIRVSPIRVKKNNEYYIEVTDELKNADAIQIIFNIRNIRYKYTLK